MKRENFKTITEKHFKTCDEIIKADGVCVSVECQDCPFHYENVANEKLCFENGYTAIGKSECKDYRLLCSAKYFIGFKGRK